MAAEPVNFLIPPNKDDVETIRASRLFDAEWYVSTYPDVKAMGIDAAEHYLWLGARLNRRPSPKFDPAQYLERNSARNEMMARAVLGAGKRLKVFGEGYAPRGTFESDGTEVEPGEHRTLRELIRCAVLCNDAELRQDAESWIVAGEPMEGALVSLGLKGGEDPAQVRPGCRVPTRSRLTPSTATWATLHHSHDGRAFVCLKGAPERILAMCSRQMGDAGPEPINPDDWRRETEALASEGQRILAFATKEMPQRHERLSFADVYKDVSC